jgi:hypothetical protein
MWFAPRRTLRAILDSGDRRAVLPLAAALGVSQALDQAANHDMGARAGLPAILATGIAVGAVAGPLVLLLAGSVLRWTGSWLGGRGSAVELRTGLAWGQVPAVSALPLWVPVILAGGREVFRAAPELSASATATVLACGIAMAGAALWGAATSVLCVAEAHRFSAWKGLGTVLLGLLVVALPAAAIGVAIHLLAAR